MRVLCFTPLHIMDTQHLDTHENTGGFWPLVAQIFGIGFSAFALVAGIAFIYSGLKYSGAPAPQASSPSAVASASAPIAAVPAASSAGAVAAGGAVTIKPDAVNPMSYDTKSFTVKAGQSVKLTFSNDSAVPLQHNLVIGKIGTKDAIIALANTMMTQPDALAKGYIPESPEILWHTKLLNPKESQTLDFTAPAEKGDYPYLCTFPGHSIIMNGVMKVE